MLAALGLAPFDSLRQVQPVPLGAVLRRSEARMSDLRPQLAAYYARHPASLMRRLWSTLRHGLSNHYLTVAARRG